MRKIQGFFCSDIIYRCRESKIKIVQEAQKTDLALTKYLNLLKADFTRRGMQVSPQGVLYKVMDGKHLMIVPHELCQKILVENHDVPIATMRESTEQCTSLNGIIGGVVSGEMSWPTCDHVRCVNA